MTFMRKPLWLNCSFVTLLWKVLICHWSYFHVDFFPTEDEPVRPSEGFFNRNSVRRSWRMMTNLHNNRSKASKKPTTLQISAPLPPNATSTSAINSPIDVKSSFPRRHSNHDLIVRQTIEQRLQVPDTTSVGGGGRSQSTGSSISGSIGSDLHGSHPVVVKKPSFLNFESQRNSSLSPASFGSSDPEAETPPPSFKPPSPPRSPVLHPSHSSQDVSPFNLHSNGDRSSLRKKKSTSKSISDMLSASTTSKKSHNRSGGSQDDFPSPPNESTDFLALHRQAQSTLRVALHDKVSF